MDEVPSEERENTQVWLNELLAHYPATRCLVTVRPLAVEEEWLRSEDFHELRLLPMRNKDIQEFVRAWHRAARLECDTYGDKARAESERAELTTLEAELQEQFSRNRALRTLARTPLLCAVICALHRRRGGLLPDTRWELYRATLAMLLGGRDARRGIANPDGITMGFEEHQELLQSLAVWLVRGGQAQLSRAEAEQQIEVAMRRLPQVRAQGSPASVLTHLLNRSGLLQERADDEIQFIHRTFQDYLAARALVEDGSLKELLGNAHKEQWQDTVLLAVGHCRPREVHWLIEGLLTNGENTSDEERQAILYALAARCLLNTVVVDETVSDRVASRIRTLLPPHRMADQAVLAPLADYLLDLLPEPSALGAREVRYVAEIICRIGGREGVRQAKRYAQHGGTTAQNVFAFKWSRFPTEEFARDVLTEIPLTEAEVRVADIGQLHLLRQLAPFGGLTIQGDFSGAQLERNLADVHVSGLSLWGNSALEDLAFVQLLPHLAEFSALDCPGITSLSPLEKTDIQLLDLHLGGLTQAHLRTIAHIPKLTMLSLQAWGTPPVPELPPAHPGVLFLALECQEQGDLSTLHEWSALRALSLGIDSCTWLVHGQRTITPAPQIRKLDVSVRSDYAGLEHIATAFPALTELDLSTRVPRSQQLDLTPLHALPDLQVTVSVGRTGRLVLHGTEPFGDRLTVNQ